MQLSAVLASKLGVKQATMTRTIGALVAYAAKNRRLDTNDPSRIVVAGDPLLAELCDLAGVHPIGGAIAVSTLPLLVSPHLQPIGQLDVSLRIPVTASEEAPFHFSIPL